MTKQKMLIGMSPLDLKLAIADYLNIDLDDLLEFTVTQEGGLEVFALHEESKLDSETWAEPIQQYASAPLLISSLYKESK